MQGWRTAVETNIQKMQVQLETVRAGSFTRAAERLSYSQSGVSRMVADLEADWGFKVLDRSREGVALSADGRQVMPAVEALCEEFVRLQRRVDEMRGLMRGKICIGTFSSVATHVLPPVIARFRADYPDIDYELLMGDYSEIEQWVAEGRCDLGFIPHEPRENGMTSRSLVRDELMAVVPADSLLATEEVVSLAALADYGYGGGWPGRERSSCAHLAPLSVRCCRASARGASPSADQCDISHGRRFACRRSIP